ncbi:MaoC family dehydratase N-terminal domain-containing protein [Saccharopolyspora sp. NPDC050642]|uniref:MaoC family dehydratase N-terminal domain-containing protein n=1 Tax=Saccharopolyspora sp. NPDC050642 TaxID=3157099 RepID=UPI00340A2181
MNDPTSLVGRVLPAFSTAAERGQLALFAQVIGEDDPVYLEVGAARAAGFPDLPIPPTFLFSLELRRPDPRGALRELGVDLRQVLHGEQVFDYHRPAFAGEVLDFEPRISDYYEKKGGALRFLVRRTEVSRAGEPIAALTNTLVVRDLELT